jgi:Mn2+/Fe2+ NRAMP family transporter
MAEPIQNTSDSIKPPPNSTWQILRQLGPGFIMAASIVGSGELIATTNTGAEAGMSLLWLIIIGCLVKVFVQIEIGRATIITGKQTLSALSTIPGPRVNRRGNWLVWYWFFMWFCSILQLGGIVGACGQALATIAPITAEGKAFVEATGKQIETEVEAVMSNTRNKDSQPSAAIAPNKSRDDFIWCIPIAIGTSILLMVGRYGAIQSISTVLVVIFTGVTLWNVIAIQQLPDWHITADQFIQGLSFSLPESDDSSKAIFLALSTVGIIGVGAAELIQYPYWCLEKGYARWTGPNDGSKAWTERARGWLKVMRYDAWCSMIIYTFATIAFYILGAAILHRLGLMPENEKMLQTLMAMYTPVFGKVAIPIFIVGALAVLYSTFFVANASHARTFTDGLCVTNIVAGNQQSRDRWVKILSFCFPLLCLLVYYVIPKPGTLVAISGAAQTLMLPMLGYAALVFRYRDTPKELRPSIFWDLCLWSTIFVMFLIAMWQTYTHMLKLVS